MRGVKVKTYSKFLVLFVLIVSIIAVAGCSKSGGGSSSKDIDITNEQGVIENFYKITDSTTTTKLPAYVNLYFHIEDNLGHYIPTLELTDFEILENGEELSPNETTLILTSYTEVPYTLKTVLMIDNSSSFSEEELQEFKDAAIDLVNAIAKGGDTTGNLEFKIYSFAGSFVEKSDFTNVVEDIRAAIESIGSGDASTDFYGSVIEGVSNWTDSFNQEFVEEGVLLLFTDGNDTQNHEEEYEDVLSAIEDKKIITVGFGAEMKPDVLEAVGNTAFYRINLTDDTSDEASGDTVIDIADYDALVAALTDQLSEIESEIAEFSSTFYKLNYLSPKRGEDVNPHKLTMTLKVRGNKNTNEENGAELDAEYDCSEFFSAREGIYINNTIEDPYVDINSSSFSTKVNVNVYLNKSLPGKIPAVPAFSIINSCDDGDDTTEDVMTIAQEDPDDLSVFTIRTTDNGLCDVTITDVNNQYSETTDFYLQGDNFSQTFKVNITKSGLPGKGLIRYYAFDGNEDDSSSGGVNHGTAGAGVTYENAYDRYGVEGKAILLNNTGYIDIPPIVDTDQFTVSMWYRRHLVGSNLNTLLGGSNDKYRHLILQPSTRVVGFYNDGWFLADDNYAISYNVWFHIVLVKDGTNSKLYAHNVYRNYDGANLVQESDESFDNSLSPLSVIGNIGGSYDQGAEGVIDDVRIYNRVLSDTEIKTLFDEQ